MDAAIRQYLDDLGESQPFDLAAAREAIDLLSAIPVDVVPVEVVFDAKVAGVPVRSYLPAGPPRILPLIWFHGGGWVAGSLDAVDPLCRALASTSGAALTSVAYRLAPEHPFPAALEDCVAVLRAAATDGPVVVGGDSAGGGLAAAACLALGDEDLPITAQVLLNPLLDATLSSPSIWEFASGFGLTRESLEEFARLYVGAGDPADPLCSPLLAPSLAGLPPAVIVTAEFDPLRDEGEDYAVRLAEAGVVVRVRRWDGMVHGFMGLWSVTPAAAEAMEWTVAALAELTAF